MATLPRGLAVDPLLVSSAPVRTDLVLCSGQGGIAGTDHDREWALELVPHVCITGTGQPLKLEIAAVEHGATETDRDYAIQFVV